MEDADESIPGEDIPVDPAEPAFRLSAGIRQRHAEETCSCRAVFSAVAGLKIFVTAFSAGFMATGGHIAGAQLSLGCWSLGTSCAKART
jgi:hypothetical protein